MKAVAGFVGLMMIMLFWNACNAPIVFKTTDGRVCACMVDRLPANMKQCKQVNFNKPYETVWVINDGECK